MKRKLTVGAVLSTSVILAGAIQVSAGTAQADPSPVSSPQASRQHGELLAQAAAVAPATAHVLGLGSQEQLIPKDAVVDADGTRHLRFERTYGGIPVIGGDLVVHQSANGSLTSVDRAVNERLNLPSLTPKLSAGQATAQATGTVRANIGVTLDSDEAALKEVGTASAAKLVVWATSGTPRLAYQTTVEGMRVDGTPSRQLLVTDAASGALLSSHEEIQTANAAGTGKGVFVGSVPLTTNYTGTTYQLKDASRGGQYTTTMKNRTSGNGTLYTNSVNTWGTGTVSNSQSAAVDAQYGAAATWDFYKNTFGRSGIRNNGVGAFSRVHYGSSYTNAFWDDSCFCMTYGDGASNTHPLTEIDVSGHEMTHGVTAATAALNYSGESGGLNEATSDILGTGVEWYANLPSNPPNYWIGELINLRGNGTPLRWMDKPSTDGSSADSWYSGVGNLDVHYSSGVANHFFYLLSEGSGAKSVNGFNYNSPTANGVKVTGIGRAKALQVWYRALTTYFTSTTDYKAARVATLKATADLYGASGTEYAQVAAAWTGVNVS